MALGLPITLGQIFHQILQTREGIESTTVTPDLEDALGVDTTSRWIFPKWMPGYIPQVSILTENWVRDLG